MSYVLKYKDTFDQLDTNVWDVHSSDINIVEIKADPTNSSNNTLYTETSSSTRGDIARVVYKGSINKPFKIVIKVYNVDTTSKGNNVAFGIDSDNNVYFVNVNPANSTVSIARVGNDRWNIDRPETLQSFDISNLGLQMEQWYTLEIEVKSDNTVNISINNQQVGSYTVDTDIDPFVHLGAVVGGKTYYDDFELYGTQSYGVTLIDIGYVEEGEVSNAKFDITSVNPTSITVNKGGTVNITVGIKNIGNASGDVTLRVKLNDSIVTSKTVTLDAGQEQSVQLSWTAPSTIGTYNYTIEAYNESTSSVDDTANVTVNVTEVVPSGGATTSFPWWLIVIAIILLLLLGMSSRRR